MSAYNKTSVILYLSCLNLFCSRYLVFFLIFTSTEFFSNFTHIPHLLKNYFIKESYMVLTEQSECILAARTGLLLVLWRFLTIESPIKMMKNAFYFVLKACFVCHIHIFVLRVWLCSKMNW